MDVTDVLEAVGTAWTVPVELAPSTSWMCFSRDVVRSYAPALVGAARHVPVQGVRVACPLSPVRLASLRAAIPRQRTAPRRVA